MVAADIHMLVPIPEDHGTPLQSTPHPTHVLTSRSPCQLGLTMIPLPCHGCGFTIRMEVPLHSSPWQRAAPIPEPRTNSPGAPGSKIRSPPMNFPNCSGVKRGAELSQSEEVSFTMQGGNLSSNGSGSKRWFVVGNECPASMLHPRYFCPIDCVKVGYSSWSHHPSFSSSLALAHTCWHVALTKPLQSVPPPQGFPLPQHTQRPPRRSGSPVVKHGPIGGSNFERPTKVALHACTHVRNVPVATCYACTHGRSALVAT